MNHQRLATLAVVIVTGTAALAQERPPAPEPAFEVASVRLNPNDNIPEGISLQAEGVRFTGFRVRTLITMAYRSEGIQRFDRRCGIRAAGGMITGRAVSVPQLAGNLPVLVIDNIEKPTSD